MQLLWRREEYVSQKKSKKIVREQEVEMRKENSHLSLLNSVFLFLNEREIQCYHVAFGEQMLLLVRVF